MQTNSSNVEFDSREEIEELNKNTHFQEDTSFKLDNEPAEPEEIESDEEDVADWFSMGYEEVPSKASKSKLQPSSDVKFVISAAPKVMTAEEKRLHAASMALSYGILKQDKVKLRFIIGPREVRKPPGKGPKEIDQFKRKWFKLVEFGKRHNWRKILDNDFNGDYLDDPMTFIIDGVEWKTVLHFMLGMLYINSPNYAIMYSLASRDNPNGFWGLPSAARSYHEKNLSSGQYNIDPDYARKVEEYLFNAIRAKCTQNPIAKEALMLTEDAVLSIRGGPVGVLDLPVYDRIKEWIRENPKKIYKGPNTPMEIEPEDMVYINSAEELNIGVVTGEVSEDNPLVAGRVTADTISTPLPLKPIIIQYAQQFPGARVETEDIAETACIIHLATGYHKLNFWKLIEDYGKPNPSNQNNAQVKFVSRHIYGVERIGDDPESNIMIGIQRGVSSIEQEYVVINTQISAGNGNMLDISIYLQIYPIGFTIFILSATNNEEILGFLKYIISNNFGAAPTTQ